MQAAGFAKDVIAFCSVPASLLGVLARRGWQLTVGMRQAQSLDLWRWEFIPNLSGPVRNDIRSPESHPSRKLPAPTCEPLFLGHLWLCCFCWACVRLST